MQLTPNDPAARTDLARIHNRLGILHSAAKKGDAALRSFEKARDLLQALRGEAPDDLTVEGELAVTHNCLGNLHSRLGRHEKARIHYRACIDLNRDLCRRSSDRQYPYALALSLGNLAGLVASEAGRRDEAWSYSDEANKLLRQIVRDEPHVPRYRQELGRNLLNSGIRLNGEKNHEKAIKSLSEGREVLTRLVEMQPRIPWYQRDLVRLLKELGSTYRRAGEGLRDESVLAREQFAKALEAFQEAGRVQKELAVKDPQSAETQYRLAGCSFNIGIVQAKLERKNESIQAYQDARDLLRRLIGANPDNLDYRNLLGLTLNNLGHELWLTKHPDDALTSLREGVEHNRLVFSRSPRSLYYRRVLNTNYVFQADLFRGTGRRDELMAALLEQRALWADNAAELFTIACELARAKADTEAMRTLEQAVRQGFRDVRRVETEAALAELRPRPEFHKLLQEMKAK